MDNLNINFILKRESIYNEIKKILSNFEKNKFDLSLKRGIYIYGAPGGGKTEFITRLLKEINYDVIIYDAGDIRNKSIIENITRNNMSNKSVISLFSNKPKPIAIIMDEIDGMNNGDKGGINSLIKLIRQKKTKKQKLEEITYNPIICIGSYHQDKKIKELTKVCNTFELKIPTDQQISTIITKLMPNLEVSLSHNMCKFISGDLRKLASIYKIYQHNMLPMPSEANPMPPSEANPMPSEANPTLLTNDLFTKIFKNKTFNEDTKIITKHLINKKHDLSDHLTTLNENDRTIVGLLWHENIIDPLSKIPPSKALTFYSRVLDNLCFADYMDRVTFQHQIWQFNEMSSLIKTFHCNKMYHDTFPQKPLFNPAEVRFTKVLTKYSSEYNNATFINDLCQSMGLDKKDTFALFLDLQSKHSDDYIKELLENNDISNLYVNRIYRYMDKCIDEAAIVDVISIDELVQ
jgi:hypothetical protein